MNIGPPYVYIYPQPDLHSLLPVAVGVFREGSRRRGGKGRCDGVGKGDEKECMCGKDRIGICQRKGTKGE